MKKIYQRPSAAAFAFVQSQLPLCTSPGDKESIKVDASKETDVVFSNRHDRPSIWDNGSEE